MADVIRDVRQIYAWLGDLAKPGSVTMMLIGHEPWCPTLRTDRASDCLCRPDYAMKEVVK